MTELSSLPKLNPEREAEVVNIFRQSYQHSQGDDTLLQKDIFRWLLTNDFLKRSEIEGFMPKPAYDIKPPKTHEAVTKGMLPMKRLENNWGIINELYPTKSPEEYNNLLDRLLNGIITSDTLYQDKERPNRNPRPNTQPDFQDDPHASFLRRHMVKSLPTGQKAYDEMYKTLRERVEETKDQQEIPWKAPLQELVTKWEANHPGHTFFPEKTAE